MYVNFPNDDHDNPEDSQLLVAMTGTPEFIKERLAALLAEMNQPYGKPCQGTGIHHNGTVSVITPLWDKKTY